MDSTNSACSCKASSDFRSAAFNTPASVAASAAVSPSSCCNSSRARSRPSREASSNLLSWSCNCCLASNSSSRAALRATDCLEFSWAAANSSASIVCSLVLSPSASPTLPTVKAVVAAPAPAPTTPLRSTSFCRNACSASAKAANHCESFTRSASSSALASFCRTACSASAIAANHCESFARRAPRASSNSCCNSAFDAASSATLPRSSTTESPLAPGSEAELRPWALLHPSSGCEAARGGRSGPSTAAAWAWRQRRSRCSCSSMRAACNLANAIPVSSKSCWTSATSAWTAGHVGRAGPRRELARLARPRGPPPRLWPWR